MTTTERLKKITKAKPGVTVDVTARRNMTHPVLGLIRQGAGYTIRLCDADASAFVPASGATWDQWAKSAMRESRPLPPVTVKTKKAAIAKPAAKKKKR